MDCNDNLGSIGLRLSLVLMLAACSKTTGGGDPQWMAPVGAGGSGAGAAAPAAGTVITGTAGATEPAGTAGAGSGGSTAPVAGADGSAGTDGSAGAPQAGAPEAGSGGTAETPDGGMLPPEREDLGMGDGSDVVTIGDSWMNIFTNGGGIEGGLDRAGTDYRHYAVAGTTLINGDIPAQYGRAKSANPNISTVIMTGGGNDIMFTGGCNTAEACEMSVQRIVDALDELWTQMADDGVKDVVFVQYSRNVGTAPEGTRPMTAPTPTICTTGRIGCHSIPTTDLVAATDAPDGIHPNRAACDRIAAAVLERMEAQGVRR